MTKTDRETNRHGAAPIFIVFAIWLAILTASLVSYAPVQPLPVSSPQNQFSAGRAESTLELLVGDAIPHPAGSEQNVVVRNRIVKLLESYGYEVEIQHGNTDLLDNPVYRRPPVELANIIAIRKGSTPGNAIMLASHYDSTPNGPGAADDGIGASASIEIARMLAEEETPTRDVVFLITDGEELGLQGATLFVEQHPLAKKIGVAINLEARGTTGPSMMFETGGDSRPLIKLFADKSRSPFASSLFYEIYKRMPNDTDFTVFRREGIAGYNFAIMGDVVNYHTPFDNFENADRGSLQHHGENALALVRGLLDSDDADLIIDGATNGSNSNTAQSDNAVYFDLFGQVLVWWPEEWSLWLTLASTVLFTIATWRFQTQCQQSQLESKNPESSWTGKFSVNTFRHLLLHLVLVVTIVLLVYGLQDLVRRDDRLSHPWPKFPVPILLGYWCCCFTIVGALSLATESWNDTTGAWISCALIWLGAAFVSTQWLSGASYLFIVPALLATSMGVASSFLKRPIGISIATIGFAVSVGLTWIPLEALFYDGVGLKMPFAMLLRMVLLASTLLGVMTLISQKSKYYFTMAMLVLMVLSLIVAFVQNSGA